MRKGWIYAIQIALSLVVVMGLATGCALPSATSPPASEYPADISGRVIIAEKVRAKYNRDKPDTMELTPLEGKIFWIVDISVKNKTYKDLVTASYKDWKIVAGDKVYDSQKPFMDIWPSTSMSVLVGAAGETTFRFAVPDTLKVSGTKLCYQGQEPYSYGKLTGGDRVAVYDWDLREEIKPVDTYLVMTMLTKRYMELKTVASWQGTSSKKMDFKAAQAPCVINYGYKPTSQITHSISVYAWKDKQSPMGLEAQSGPMRGVGCLILEEDGNYTIEVKAVGVEWWVKVGVE